MEALQTKLLSNTANAKSQGAAVVEHWQAVPSDEQSPATTLGGNGRQKRSPRGSIVLQLVLIPLDSTAALDGGDSSYQRGARRVVERRERASAEIIGQILDRRREAPPTTGNDAAHRLRRSPQLRGHASVVSASDEARSTHRFRDHCRIVRQRSASRALSDIVTDDGTTSLAPVVAVGESAGKPETKNACIPGGTS